ncbi:MAG: hypothetical protein BroJett011_46750 [Chloroflexota bacterium]|nr:MAG: hypothetical protein BroJett011_46750 [Chloroflexota bacterium]
MLETKCPSPTPGYHIEMMDNEVILFHPAKARIIYGNHSSALIWQLCNGQRTLADIIRLLSQAYPDSAQAIDADVRETLLTFAEQGAIIWV